MRSREIIQKIRNKFTKREIVIAVKKLFILFSPLATTALVVLIQVKLDNYIPLTAFSLFFLIVFFHAAIGGKSAGVFASFVTTLAGNFFFIDPKYSFKSDLVILFQTSVFFAQAIIIAFVTGNFFASNIFLGRKNLELASNTQKLREVINSVFTIIVIINKEGKVVEANNTFQDISEQSGRYILLRNIFNSVPWSYSKEVKDRLRNAIKNVQIGNPVKYDDRIRVGKDNYMDVEINIVGVDEDKNGQPELLIISTLDISSRKLYEDELIKGREIYTKLINSNIIGMVIGDLEGNLFEANRSFLNMIGIEDTDFEPEKINLKDLVSTQYTSDAIATSNDLANKGFYGPVDTELDGKDGSVPIMMSGVLLNKQRNEYLRLIVDLSAQKKLERKKDEFISIASHELKTPLTTLKGYTQVLQQNLTKRFQENLKYTTTIDNQLDKLNALINELLDITKIQSGKLRINKERISITELVRESIVEIRPFLDNHRINFDPNTIDIFLEADRFRIQQVVTNFLTNAIKYSEEGTEINVKIELLGKRVKVSVQDFGIGIPQDNLDKVFEKFYQTANHDPDSIEGLGLGLYISSEIIKNHGGEINVISKEGKGSTFFFLLPLQ